MLVKVRFCAVLTKSLPDWIVDASNASAPINHSGVQDKGRKEEEIYVSLLQNRLEDIFMIL